MRKASLLSSAVRQSVGSWNSILELGGSLWHRILARLVRHEPAWQVDRLEPRLLMNGVVASSLDMLNYSELTNYGVVAGESSQDEFLLQDGVELATTQSGTTYNSSLAIPTQTGGNIFQPQWNPGVGVVDVCVGDFDGDGRQDIAGRAEDGVWKVGLSNNASRTFTTQNWTTWSTSVDWLDVRVGDFNKDGRDDIVGRDASNGLWWAAISSGTSFTSRSTGAVWSTSAGWVDVGVGDANGDGLADIFGRTSDGYWWSSIASLNTGGTLVLTNQYTNAKWSGTAVWSTVAIADVNGDRRSDLVGRNAGNWWVSLKANTLDYSYVTSSSPWATWNSGVTWYDCFIADFNGDGKADVSGRTASSSGWWLGLSTGSAFGATFHGNASSDIGSWLSADMQVDDFNGDGRADFLGHVNGSSSWSLASVKPSSTPPGTYTLETGSLTALAVTPAWMIATPAADRALVPGNFYNLEGAKVPQITGYHYDSATSQHVFSGTATPNSTVLLHRMGNDLASPTATTTSGGSWTISCSATDMGGLAHGSQYHFSVRSVDAGATSTASTIRFGTRTFTATLDTAAPATSDTTPVHRVAGSAAQTDDSIVQFAVSFTEPVVGLSASNFQLVTSGGTLQDAAIASVLPAGNDWLVSVSTGTGSGTLGLNLVNRTGITDTAGNTLTGSGTLVGETYQITRPSVSTLTGGSVTGIPYDVKFNVIFSGTVTGVDAADFQPLYGGNMGGAGVYAVTGSGSTYTVMVSTGIGVGELGLRVVDNATIFDINGFQFGPARDSTNNYTFVRDNLAIAPANLVATPVSSTQINLSWSGLTNDPNADLITVWVSSDGGNFIEKCRLAGTDTACALTGLTPATSYAIRVVRMWEEGSLYTASPRARAVSSVTIATMSDPGTLLNLSAVAHGVEAQTPYTPYTIDLDWIDTGLAAAYDVEVRVSNFVQSIGTLTVTPSGSRRTACLDLSQLSLYGQGGTTLVDVPLTLRIRASRPEGYAYSDPIITHIAPQTGTALANANYVPDGTLTPGTTYLRVRNGSSYSLPSSWRVQVQYPTSLYGQTWAAVGAYGEGILDAEPCWDDVRLRVVDATTGQVKVFAIDMASNYAPPSMISGSQSNHVYSIVWDDIDANFSGTYWIRNQSGSLLRSLTPAEVAAKAATETIAPSKDTLDFVFYIGKTNASGRSTWSRPIDLRVIELKDFKIAEISSTAIDVTWDSESQIDSSGTITPMNVTAITENTLFKIQVNTTVNGVPWQTVRLVGPGENRCRIDNLPFGCKPTVDVGILNPGDPDFSSDIEPYTNPSYLAPDFNPPETCPANLGGEDSNADGGRPAVNTQGGSTVNGNVSVPLGGVALGSSTVSVSQSWTNQSYLADGIGGNGMASSNLPNLKMLEDDSISLASGSDVRHFVLQNGTYIANDYHQDTLVNDAANDRLVRTDTQGNKTFFYNFDETVAQNLRGKLVKFVDFNGITTTFSDDGTTATCLLYDANDEDTSNNIYELRTSTFDSNGRLTQVALQRRLGLEGTPTAFRKVFYEYYTGSEVQSARHGNAGNLRRMIVTDGVPESITDPNLPQHILDQTYCRYYLPGEINGYVGGLKYSFGDTSYRRLSQVYTSASAIDNATDAQVASYADQFLAYDDRQRVITRTAQASGCSSACNGLGTFNYWYFERDAYAYMDQNDLDYDTYNTWKYKTIETLPGFDLGSGAAPDPFNISNLQNTRNVYYANVAGGIMLKVTESPDPANPGQWKALACEYTAYDKDGRVVLNTQGVAVTGYSETFGDLLNKRGGSSFSDYEYQYIDDSKGALYLTGYGDGSTITGTPYYNPAGYEIQQAVRHGDGTLTSSPITLSTTQYIQVTTNASSLPFYFPGRSTVYANTDGTGQRTTLTEYGFAPDSTMMLWQKTTVPAVSNAHNGSGTATIQSEVYFDNFGRVVWSRDAGGYISYQQVQDTLTGSSSWTVRDVNTNWNLDFAGASVPLPTGWSTPGGGGLRLANWSDQDALGRTTRSVDSAAGVALNTTYTLYNDLAQETRTYPNWHPVSPGSNTYTTTGPIQVSRTGYGTTTQGTLTVGTSYQETLTIAEQPFTSSTPSGTETITSANLRSLSRTFTNAGNQVVESDVYFNLSGIDLADSDLHPGTSGAAGNYYATTYSYNRRGWLKRTQSPTGTVSRTLYDNLGRTISSWVGTNDTPLAGSGPWSETNNTGSSNMIRVSESRYDADSNLIYSLSYPGYDQPVRSMQYLYDWRGRQIGSKSGISFDAAGALMTGLEGTSVNRSMTVAELNNLGETLAAYRFDADGIALLSYANGPWNGSGTLLNASALRAYSTTSYDELGRVYHTGVYSVHPDTGAISSSALVSNTWYDERGQVIKTQTAGSAASKTAFDSVGRVVSSYITDAGGDTIGTPTSWTEAKTLTDDIVLSQVDYCYDGYGHVTQTASKERFHNAAGTGALDSTTARVSYLVAYYDVGGRLTDTVNYGTVAACSDTALVTSYSYDDSGRLSIVTDPRGLQTKTLFNALGQTTSTIAAYTDGTPTANFNQKTDYTFDGAGHTLELTADMPAGTNDQKTGYLYDLSTANLANPAVFNHDTVWLVRYPDKTTGEPSANTSDQVRFFYNALGEVRAKVDQNGSVHVYSMDRLGRPVGDEVARVGTGVDGTVRKITISYTSAGQEFQRTSLNAAGTVLDQIQYEYNGLGQLTKEYQAHSGTVTTASTLKVQYGYGTLTQGSRLTSVIYPNGRTLTYSYDETIGRLNALTENSGTLVLESYTYLGLGTVVSRTHSQPGVDLTYIKLTAEPVGDAGDQYTGLDRFGRVVDQRWLKTSDGTARDRFQYGYDRDSNRLYKANLVNTGMSELYHAGSGYDSLNRLTDFQRGTLTADRTGLVGSATRSQSWSLDALGNMGSITTNGTLTTRTHNSQNQITSGSLTYDNNGNTLKDTTGQQFVYDAWNRMVAIKNASGTLTQSYGYDAGGRRIKETPASGTATDLYYSSQWQVLEERQGATITQQYVWSPVYVDAMVLRDRNADGQSANGLEERLYVLQDANFNVTGVMNTSGVVQERVVYDPYGQPTFVNATTWATASDTLSWRYLHQGGRYDAASQTMDFRNRAYSTALSRWLQMDPVGYIDGVNAYRALRCSPAVWLDPTGNVASTQATTQPSTGPTIPVTGNEPVYDPDKWNYNSDIRIYNKCFEYALNIIKPLDAYDKYTKIGINKDGNVYSGKIKTCEGLIKLAEADGLVKLKSCDGECPASGRRVALYVSEVKNGQNDFHWARQDSNGKWSHKLGEGIVTNQDAVNNEIVDPVNADMRFGDKHTMFKLSKPIGSATEAGSTENNYRFCACFSVDPKVQIKWRTQEELNKLKVQ